jgi:VWFA-related protein
VTDKNGNRIENLNAGNFQISEDNHLQRLTAVDYFDVGKAQNPQNSEPIFISLTDTNDSETLRAVGHDHRLIVLFFDLTSYRPVGGAEGPDLDNLFRSVTAAKKFVKDRMTPADLVTVTAFSKELVVKAELTNDRETLDQALDSLLPGKGAGTVNDRANVSTYGSLVAAEALSDLLARIPGRKSVIHFTGGLPQSDPTRINPELDRTTGVANEGNVSFYEFDARGFPAGSQQFNGSRNVLDALAHDTGGALFTDLNDLTGFFKQVQDDSTGYYLLSYESSNKQHDGRYRSISVKLIGVPGGHVKYRQGYIAPRDSGSSDR